MTDPSFFPADEPLDEAPLFAIEPKDRDPRSERKRQAELVRRLRNAGLAVTARKTRRRKDAANAVMAEVFGSILSRKPEGEE